MRVTFRELKNEFKRVLISLSFTEAKAELCAEVFAANSLDGVYSHGLNRFPVFAQYVRDGLVRPDAEPELVAGKGLIETWEGNLAPGMYNARICMDRAIALAKENGLGCVSLRNTNHWMRGGTYGWQAADAGCIGICTTNTTTNMPPWGGVEPRLGNNPLVIAIPHNDGHVVLDMAISQFSFGRLQEYEFNGEQLPVPGGYDEKGSLSTDPAAISRSMRALPVGFWKGSGLSLVLDVLLTALSGGRSVRDISTDKKETGVTQLFLCLHREDLHADLIREILDYTKTSAPVEPEGAIYYPGEQTLKTRRENGKNGIPVNEGIWNRVLAM
ncbi:3-dehydro-L-gulonate 2-dehydrogenase [Arcticibacter tournemirensis]